MESLLRLQWPTRGPKLADRSLWRHLQWVHCANIDLTFWHAGSDGNLLMTRPWKQGCAGIHQKDSESLSTEKNIATTHCCKMCIVWHHDIWKVTLIAPTTSFGVWEDDIAYWVHVPWQSWLNQCWTLWSDRSYFQAYEQDLVNWQAHWSSSHRDRLFWLPKSRSDWLTAASLLVSPWRHILRRNTSKIEIENVEPKTEWSIWWQKKVWCLTRLNHLQPKVHGRLPLLCIGFCPALFSPRPMPPEKWKFKSQLMKSPDILRREQLSLPTAINWGTSAHPAQKPFANSC